MALIVVAGMGAACHADSIIPLPVGTVFASQGNTQGMRLSTKHIGTLFSVDPDGNEIELWKGPLADGHSWPVVPDDGTRFVTLSHVGSQHNLVVYDAGKVLADYRLEDFLTPDELATKVYRTSPTRHWTMGAKYDYSYRRENGKWTATTFTITLKWWRRGAIERLPGGKALEFDLATGRISKVTELLTD